MGHGESSVCSQQFLRSRAAAQSLAPVFSAVLNISPREPAALLPSYQAATAGEQPGQLAEGGRSQTCVCHHWSREKVVCLVFSSQKKKLHGLHHMTEKGSHNRETSLKTRSVDLGWLCCFLATATAPPAQPQPPRTKFCHYRRRHGHTRRRLVLRRLLTLPLQQRRQLHEVRESYLHGGPRLTMPLPGKQEQGSPQGSAYK